MDDLRVTRSVTIPGDELQLSFARSSGPGGQHVNTSDTKVELRFDLGASTALTPSQKDRIRSALGNRITSAGVLVLSASEFRSQVRNRVAVRARLANLLAEALRPARPRRPTRPSAASRERRLRHKARQAQTKRLRRPPDPD